MKYIRTKDGIIESSRVKFLENGQVELTDGKHSWRLDRFPILKQADSIEELCDEFVLFSYDREIKPSLSRVLFPLQKYVEIHKDYEIYGAIWTDKGLIYVAKMNDKGELELL